MLRLFKRCDREGFGIQELCPARGGESKIDGKPLVVVGHKGQWIVCVVDTRKITWSKLKTFENEGAAERYCRERFGLTEDE